MRALRIPPSSYQQFSQAYLELRTAAYNRTGFRFTSPELSERTHHLAFQDSVAIGVLDYRFNLIDTLAAQQGLLRDEQGMAYDVPGRPRSPYLTRAITLAAALTDTTQQQQVHFTLAPAFFFANTGRTVSSLLIDFGAGSGPQVYAPGQTIGVNYPTAGAKVLRYTVHFTDGSSATALSTLFVNPTPYQAKPGDIQTLESKLELPIPIFSATIPFEEYTWPYRSIHGRGDGHLYVNNAAIDPNRLSRPVILVDGFDPGSTTTPTVLYDEDIPKSLIDYFEQVERDLIILNFPEYTATARLRSGATQQVTVDGGADYIERNAFVLIKLIQDMKGRLAPGEKFTIIGPSMGGLITRYALAYMEEKYRTTGLPEWDHRSALWISLNSPHQGANVPLGDQEFLNYYKGLSAAAGENLNVQLNSPAARQMLVHHYQSGSESPQGAPGFRDRFMKALRDNGVPGSLGYPVQVRRVATANGRMDGGSATYGTPGGVALQIDIFLRIRRQRARRRNYFLGINTTGAFSSADVNFTPGPFNRGRIFKGQINGLGILGSGFKISPIKRVFAYSVAQGSYDLAPGGFYNAQEIIVTSTEEGERGEPYDAVFRNVSPYHDFIPTVSALGFQYQSMTNYQTTFSLPNPYTRLQGRDLICLNETPFDAYYGTASENTKHVDPDLLGLAFLSRELEAKTEKPVFTAASATICPNSSTEFTLPASCGRFPITYTWTLSGNLRFANGQTTASGTTQSIYGTSSGSGQVTVVASQQGLAASEPLVYLVTVTASEVTGTYSCPSCNSGSQPLLTDNQVPAGSITLNITSPTSREYNFSVSSTNFSITKTGPKSAYFTMGPYSDSRLQGVSVTVTPTEGCAKATSFVFRQPSSYSFTYSPNPASDELTVKAVDEGQPADGPASTTAPPFEADLYDNYGKKVKSKKSEKGKAVLDVRDLPNGLYNLRAGKGKEAISEHIQITH